MSCLDTLLRHGFSLSRSWLSVDTCISCLGSVSSFHVLSCLMSHDCVLTVSLAGIAECLFCAQTLACLAQSRPLGPFTRCLLIYHKMVVLRLFFGYIKCLERCTLAMSQSQTF